MHITTVLERKTLKLITKTVVATPSAPGRHTLTLIRQEHEALTATTVTTNKNYLEWMPFSRLTVSTRWINNKKEISSPNQQRSDSPFEQRCSLPSSSSGQRGGPFPTDTADLDTRTADAPAFIFTFISFTINFCYRPNAPIGQLQWVELSYQGNHGIAMLRQQAYWIMFFTV